MAQDVDNLLQYTLRCMHMCISCLGIHKSGKMQLYIYQWASFHIGFL